MRGDEAERQQSLHPQYREEFPLPVLPTREILKRALKAPQGLVAQARRVIPEASQLSAYGVALQLKGFVAGDIVGPRLEEYLSTNKTIKRVSLQG